MIREIRASMLGRGSLGAEKSSVEATLASFTFYCCGTASTWTDGGRCKCCNLGWCAVWALCCGAIDGDGCKTELSLKILGVFASLGGNYSVVFCVMSPDSVSESGSRPDFSMINWQWAGDLDLLVVRWCSSPDNHPSRFSSVRLIIDCVNLWN